MCSTVESLFKKKLFLLHPDSPENDASIQARQQNLCHLIGLVEIFQLQRNLAASKTRRQLFLLCFANPELIPHSSFFLFHVFDIATVPEAEARGDKNKTIRILKYCTLVTET